MSFTVQNVVDACQRDFMQAIGGSHANLVDYVNRAQLMILRERNWKFMESGVQQFLTQKGQTQYWIGATGAAPVYTVNTKLDLTAKEYIMRDSVRDLVSGKDLMETKHATVRGGMRNDDGSFIYGRPRQWRNSPDTPDILEIYPAPDQQNTFVPVPEAPYISMATGGANDIFTGPATYYFSCTFSSLPANGLADGTGASNPVVEGLASQTVRVDIPGDSVAGVPVRYTLTAYPPVPPLGPGAAYTPLSTGLKWSLYIGGSDGAQNRVYTGQALTQTITVPATTSAHASPLTVATLPPLGGYVINFKYYKAHASLALVTDTSLIPSKYFDVMVAATNLLAAEYLRDYSAGREADVAYWSNMYREGIRTMTLEENSAPRNPDHIRPDQAASGSFQWYDLRTFVT